MMFVLFVSFLLFQNALSSSPLLKLFGPRIINGQRAAAGQFPWQAAIYVTQPGGNFWCGGTLISDKWILTAGHCVQDATSFRIALGSTTLVGLDANRVVLDSNKYIRHEEYSPYTLANDIAVIALPEAVSFNEYIQPISLASTELSAGTTVTVSGWGLTSDAEDEPSVYLNYVNLITVTNNECKQIYGFLNTGVVCAQGNQNFVQSTCEGDSGGPLITTISGKPVHVGVVSYGHPDGCESDKPVAFTRTHYHRNWIKNKTGV